MENDVNTSLNDPNPNHAAPKRRETKTNGPKNRSKPKTGGWVQEHKTQLKKEKVKANGQNDKKHLRRTRKKKKPKKKRERRGD